MSMLVVRQRAALIKKKQMEETLEKCRTRKRMSRAEKAIVLSRLTKEVKLIPVCQKI